ncbi:putative tail fiber protein [Vibrio phage 277E43-1]|nr:putative tail fiber protein [Vibrio phage 277E43-1]
MAATQPTNPLVRIAELDTTLPGAGTPNKIVPVSSLLQQGYDKENKMFAQNINYVFDNIAQWVKFSQDRLNEVDTKIITLEGEVDDNNTEINSLKQEVISLEEQIEKERVSVGEIIEITGDSTNPSILKGYGIWESFGAGQVLVGVGTHTDDRSEGKTWADKDSEGEYRHEQTIDELVTHSHPASVSDDTHNHKTNRSNYQDDNAGPLAIGSDGYIEAQDTSFYTHTHEVTIGNRGNSAPMNNIQPSLAVYRWKRTA